MIHTYPMCSLLMCGQSQTATKQQHLSLSVWVFWMCVRTNEDDDGDDVLFNCVRWFSECDGLYKSWCKWNVISYDIFLLPLCIQRSLLNLWFASYVFCWHKNQSAPRLHFAMHTLKMIRSAKCCSVFIFFLLNLTDCYLDRIR